MPHLQRAPSSLTNDRERVGQHLCEAGASLDLLTQIDRPCPKPVIRQGAHLILARVDFGDARIESLEFSLVLGAEDLCEQRVEHQIDVKPVTRACLQTSASRRAVS